MLMINIRKAIKADAKALAVLAEKTFRDTFSADNSRSDMDICCEESFGTQIQQQEILDPNMLSLLAESEGELIGYAQVVLNSPAECVAARQASELRTLYVANNWHGRGVAQKLMAEVFAAAHNVQSDWLWLGVWEHNPKAIAFYKKYDFEAYGDHVFQLGSDPQRDIILAASLG